ncbi:MAG TPA: cytochrome c biogenesis protein CcdA [Candidatus Krumholzibacteria bacterium]|nr:cytochrome c biogenesis protein CcdA [Candidatus Krumholzibacteria bacterium]
MKKRLSLLAGVSAALIAAVPGHAQFTDPFAGEPVSATGYVSLSNVPQGGSAQLALEIKITAPWHVNANPASEEFLVPTEVAFELPPGVTLRGIVYPPGAEMKLAFAEAPLRLYDGTVYVGAVIDVASDVPIDTSIVTATITYQACDNEKCLLPQTLEVPILLAISSPRDPVDLASPEVFDRIDFTAVLGKTGDGAGSDGNALKDAIAKRGWLFAFVLVFLGGLALNLTPCVYPMIPITVSYFGGQAKGRGGRTVLLAALYLLGMAVMYSTLGLVAALTGSLFGSALQNPIVLAVIALVMVGLALSMFGVYEIRVPTRLAGVAGTAKQGTVGSFLMGLTVGIVAAPCIGPFVLGLLTFVGEVGNPLLGFSLFFVLALGLGLPFVVLAIASGNITRLPKSGEWMEWVRKLFGIVLLAMAAYFLRPIVGDTLYFILLGAVLVVGGVMLGFVSKVKTSSLFFSGFRRFVGVVAPLYGLYLVLAPGNILGRSAVAGIPWIPYEEAALVQAAEQGKAVVIDFAAEWCLPCKELDHLTFNQPEVIEAAKGIVPLKADLTQHGSPAVRELRKKFDIRGVPTIVFIDATGRERQNLRAVEFIDKEEFLSRLSKLTS